MNKKNFFLTIGILFFFPLFLEAHSVSFSSKTVDENNLEITVTMTLNPDEWLYKDFISFSVDNPTVVLSPFKSSKDAINRYDPSFKNTKKIFEHDVTFFVNTTKKTDLNGEAYLHVNSSSNKQGHEEHLFLLPFNQKNTQENSALSNEISTQKAIAQNNFQKSVDPKEKTPAVSWSTYISDMVKTIQSPFIRLLLVFLLGILLSLTPCIYPMIPITIGILQAQGSKSLFYNFLLALAYTCGMATTFALFGLVASCTGPLCGQLLMEPIFITGLVIILGYLGLSMLGLYDVYVPKFFKPAKSVKGGSLFSSFLFGAASGTIASPCVSPGLAVLLSIVATLGNKLLGFLLLFVFGVGLSTPLLIVGSFSSSLSLLPRAGMWMIEIKKLFGFMIFGMCFYYISYIVPMTILLWIIALFTAGAGCYYIYSGHNLKHSRVWKKINIWVGIVLVASSIVLLFQAYRITTYAQVDMYSNDLWHTDYDTALAQARLENKKLFIDFWATFCPICLAINKTVLTKPSILKALQEFVMVKVDGTYSSNKPYKQIKDKFSIKGFPTFLLIDPSDETIVKEWGGELYDMQEEQFISELKHNA